MGMFDDVRCEAKLPGGYEQYQDTLFQTKDFDCMMDSYTITDSGDLVEENHPYLKEGRLVLDAFEGPLNFYTYENGIGLIDFYALFKRGKLVSIDVHIKQSLY